MGRQAWLHWSPNVYVYLFICCVYILYKYYYEIGNKSLISPHMGSCLQWILFTIFLNICMHMYVNVTQPSDRGGGGGGVADLDENGF